MKNILLIICALIVSFIIVELITVFIIGYPNLVPGKKKFRIHDNLGPYNRLDWHPPYYKFWNVEGGNKCFRKNNIGLQGSDVGKNESNILVLGSSFTEAMQLPNTQIATSVLNDQLKSEKKYNVINLGASGHDPYVSWFRLKFFSRWYKPDYVILVLDPTCMVYFNTRWDDKLDFTSPFEEPKLIPDSRMRNLMNLPRVYSASINLAINLLGKKKQDSDSTPPTEDNSSFKDTAVFFSKLEQCLAQYQQVYRERFIVISMIDNKSINDKIEMICQNKNSYIASDDSLLSEDNKFHNGHLNLKGNRLLGNLLYQEVKKRF